MTGEKAQAIRSYIQSHREDILRDLETLVRAESPSNDKALCDRCAEQLAQLVKERLDVPCRRFEMEQNGKHLSARVGEGPMRVLIIGHYDTVWNPGTLALRREGNALYGPGVYDMKFGDVAAIWALRALKELNMLPPGSVGLFFNSDEEIGSGTSRPLFESQARDAGCVFILEPASGPDQGFAVKGSRKGVGMFRIEVNGRASHAGSDYEKGRSAVLEAARLTVRLFAMTDLARGTTVNVGVLSGGTKTNVVAAHAGLSVDVRVNTAAEGGRVAAAIAALQPEGEGITLEITGGMNRPPFEQTEQNRALFDRAAAIAAGMGHTLRKTHVGGGSDGNFTSALGIATLDGLGAVGDGAHAQHEHIFIDESLESMVRLAGYLSEI